MIDSLLTVLWFLVALGVLVTVHEFGHFYVARRCGVKVLRFSVGFGKQLWTWTDKQGTDYSLSAIPLGGYVKMLDEREAEVSASEVDQAFNRKGPWARIAIVAAGPFANFVLAVVLFWIMLIPGTTDLSPVIGVVDKGSIAAEAGLEVGQEIVAVDGEPTTTRQAVLQQLVYRMGETGTITFTSKYPESTLQYQSEAQLVDWLKGEGDPDVVESIGISFYQPAFKSLISQVVDESPAQRAGLKPGDEIIGADGAVIPSWTEWVAYVRARPNQQIAIDVQRNGELFNLNITPEPITLDNGEVIGRVGVGVVLPEYPEHMLRTQHYSLLEAGVKAAEKTWDTSVFVLMSLKKLIVGEISTKNLSGPITIAKVAGASAKAGMSYYVGFLALLSISLGVFNLLPIPVLDGGHLFYYLIEVIKGSPVSEKVQMIGYQMGLVLVAGVMVLALYNDVMRL
jgi:regulator of sigma E protease